MAEFPPPWPPKPDLYDEVDWGSYPSKDDCEHAYKAWRLPYDTLQFRWNTGPQDPNEVPLNGWAQPMEALVGYIHQRLRSNPFEAQDPDPDAQKGPKDWHWDDFLPNASLTAPKKQSDITSIGGQPLSHMTKPATQAELDRRNVQYDKASKRADLQALLIEDELDKLNQPTAPETLKNLFERSKLERWGLNLPDKYLLPYDEQRTYTAFELYTMAIHLSPYNPGYWTARAYLFHQQGHDDLALGDAYRALYLVEVVVDVHKRAKRPGLYPRIIDAVEQHIVIQSRVDRNIKDLLRRDQGVPYFIASVRKVCHHIIALSLGRLNAWRDAIEMDKHLLARLRMPVYDRKMFQERLKRANTQDAGFQQRRQRPLRWVERAGVIRSKPYPQAREDIDRTNNSFIQVLNQHYIQGWPGDDPDTPMLWIEAEAQENRLKVVANRPIKKGDIIYAEEPNIHGQRQFLHDPIWAQELGELDRSPPSGASDPPEIESCRDAEQESLRYFCENCKQTLSFQEVDSARAKLHAFHKAKKAGQTVDDLTDECYCLFKDPLLPFCLGAADRERDATIDATSTAQGMPATTPGSTLAAAVDNTSNVTATAPPANPSTSRTTRGTTQAAQPSGTGSKGPAPQDESSGEDAPPAQGKGKAKAKKSKSTGKSKKPVSTEEADDGDEPSPGEAGGAAAAEGGMSCLQIARANYHYHACNRTWRWLHESMQATWAVRGDLRELVQYEDHGTSLSLLLREVFDMTLLKRETTEESDRLILASEIDALYPIEERGTRIEEETGFPFTWAGNIVVPFDILESLGVNIFRQFEFDTWVIQTVLRKLLHGAVPRPVTGGEKPRNVPDAMRDLYVFTAFALFRRDEDEKAQNAVWMWDSADSGSNQDNTVRQRRPLNRIIIVALNDIDSGEEVVVNENPLEVLQTNESNESAGGQTAENPEGLGSARPENGNADSGSVGGGEGLGLSDARQTRTRKRSREEDAGLQGGGKRRA